MGHFPLHQAVTKNLVQSHLQCFPEQGIYYLWGQSVPVFCPTHQVGGWGGSGVVLSLAVSFKINYHELQLLKMSSTNTFKFWPSGYTQDHSPNCTFRETATFLYSVSRHRHVQILVNCPESALQDYSWKKDASKHISRVSTPHKQESQHFHFTATIDISKLLADNTYSTR